MHTRVRILLLLLGCSLPVLLPAEVYTETSGAVEFESRIFFQTPALADQQNADVSVSWQPEFLMEWNDGNSILTFKPFLRIDREDAHRSHADVRELMWLQVAGDMEFSAGIGKEFWGVTEALHLVDIINQTDSVENPDGEQKLGQPMIKLSVEKDWGVVDAFLLPYFRERTFADLKGRFRPSLPVDTDHPMYESGRQQHHLDVALRWSHSLGDWDIGLSGFRGTARTPRLLPVANASGQTVLSPYYDQISQLGIDVQATKESWLWKLEALIRHSSFDDYAAATGGFEYTFVGILEGNTDLGLLMEYQWDERGKQALSVFQNDVFAGIRWVVNDAGSSEVLAGVVYDLDYGSRLLNIEASRRLNDNWKLSLQARIWNQVDPADVLFSSARDDYIETRLGFYY